MNPDIPPFAFSAFGWILISFFTLGSAFWLYEYTLLRIRNRTRTSPEPAYGADDVQVRILTIDNQSVVQSTVDALPDTLTDIHVISEQPLSITGATVWAVPDDFSCTAIRKGRALEYARQTIRCDKEYVLFLDEDSLLIDLPDIPDKDIIQLAEHALRSHSWVTYFIEIFRAGYQIEMQAFEKLGFPLYAWGGGIIIRKSIEDAVTWDYESVTEDTSFIWRAICEVNIPVSFTHLDFHVYNQSPPTVWEMIQQRRRWASGTIKDLSQISIPPFWQFIIVLRSFSWAIVIPAPLLFLTLVTDLTHLWAPNVFVGLMVIQSLMFFIWSYKGVQYYGGSPTTLLIVIINTPIITFLHGLGAFWAVFHPAQSFRVTQKVAPDNIVSTKLDALTPQETISAFLPTRTHKRHPSTTRPPESDD